MNRRCEYEAGGKNVALDRAFTVTVTDGQLNLAFSTVRDNAMVSAIEAVQGGAGAPPTSFGYRGDGLRASRTVGGTSTSYTWDVQAALPVVLQDGTFSSVYGLGLLSQTDASGNQTYFLADGLGSTRALTDGSGNVVATYDYDVFGAVRASSGPAASDFRFTGQPLDPSTSLYYLRARYYDPSVGRFLSQDPFPGVLSDPTSHHPYSYVQNNPANLVDPSGACPWCPKAIEVGGQVLQRAGPWLQRGATWLGDKAQAGWRWIQGCWRSLASPGAAQEVGTTVQAAAVRSRALTAADLGIRVRGGTVAQFDATLAVSGQQATVRVNMVKVSEGARVENPFEVMNRLAEIARSEGAARLRVEGVLANDELFGVLVRRYGVQTQGALDFFEIALQ